MRYDAYVIATAPRSGSTLLCGLLAATGVAGNPASYFHRPSVADWAAKLGAPTSRAASERETLDAVFRAAVRKGRAGGDIFGLRLQAHSLPFFREKLAVLHPDGANEAARIHRAFGRTLFVHLTRPDKVDQAISYLKARESGLWHVAPDGAELERVAPHREPRYDRAAIAACIETMTAYDAAWNDWFAREGVAPVRLSYDELAAEPLAVLRDVLGRLGLDPSHADGVEPGVRKMADGASEAWSARYRAEQSAR